MYINLNPTSLTLFTLYKLSNLKVIFFVLNSELDQKSNLKLFSIVDNDNEYILNSISSELKEF